MEFNTKQDLIDAVKELDDQPKEVIDFCVTLIGCSYEMGRRDGYNGSCNNK